MGVWCLVYAATTIINTTPQLTTADDEDGLFIFDDDSVIVNSSTVTTQGISADALRIDGLQAHITNTVTGELVTEGDHFAVGIRLGRETAVVENAGSITTSGINGDGIVLFGGDGHVTNSGNILVQGAGADGFVVEGDNTVLINSGSIQSTGGVRTENTDGSPVFDDATGAYMAGYFNQLHNHANAIIETTGPEANTVNAFSGNLVANNGLLRSSGLDSTTVAIASYPIAGNFNFTTTLTNSGEIINSGDCSAVSDRCSAIFNYGPALYLENTGLIESTGTNSKAIFSSTPIAGGANQPDAIIRNSGVITSSGVNSDGTILLYGSDQFVENLTDGVIQQLADGRPAIWSPTIGMQSVSNSGLIIGDVLLGDDVDQFTVIDSGEVQGVVNGEAGIDELIVQISDLQTISGDMFTNFDTFRKTEAGTQNAQGVWDFGVSGTAVITSGAMCFVADGTLIASTLTVASEATLCGTGTISSGLIAEPGSSILPGLSPGTLEVDGDLNADQTRIVIEIAGLAPNEHDIIVVSGDVFITNSTVIFSFIEGFLPRENDTIEWLASSGLPSLDGLVVEIEGVAVGFEYDIEIGPAGVQLKALNNARAIENLIFRSGFESSLEG